MRSLLALEADVVLSGRAAYANSCIAAGVSSGRVVTLVIVRSSIPSLI